MSDEKSKKFISQRNFIFRESKNYKNKFRRLRESCVVIKHHRTNVSCCLLTAKIVHHHYPLFLLLFLYFALGRKKTSCVKVVLDADSAGARELPTTAACILNWSGLKSVHASCEKSLLVNRRFVETLNGYAAFSTLHGTPHTLKCFQGFFDFFYFFNNIKRSTNHG